MNKLDKAAPANIRLDTNENDTDTAQAITGVENFNEGSSEEPLLYVDVNLGNG